MATITMANGSTAYLKFNNSQVGIPPERISGIVWSLLSTGNGALSLTLPDRLQAFAEGVGQVQASVSLVSPVDSQIHKCWVEVTPTPAPGQLTTQNPVTLDMTFVVAQPTVPAVLHLTDPTFIDLGATGTLECKGVRFTTGHKIWLDGVERVTTYSNPTKLTCPIPASATAKLVDVWVKFGTDETTKVKFEYKEVL